MDETPEVLASHFEDPYHRGACDRPTHVGESQDSLTQHWVTVQLRVDEDEVVADAWFDAEGCLFCEAPASLLMQFCEGRSFVELEGLSEAAFLKLTQLDQLAELPECSSTSLKALREALSGSPVDCGEDAEGLPGFGGPSLSEEV